MHKTRVPVPSLCEAPPEVLRLIREPLPTADLYYAGGGRWWLLDWSNKPERIRLAGQNMMELNRSRCSTPWEFEQRALLALAGFSLLGEYTVSPIGNGDWYRERVSLIVAADANQLEAGFEESLDAAAEGPKYRNRIQVMQDFRKYEAPSVYRHAFGKRVVAAVNGLRRLAGAASL